MYCGTVWSQNVVALNRNRSKWNDMTWHAVTHKKQTIQNVLEHNFIKFPHAPNRQPIFTNSYYYWVNTIYNEKSTISLLARIFGRQFRKSLELYALKQQQFRNKTKFISWYFGKLAHALLISVRLEIWDMHHFAFWMIFCVLRHQIIRCERNVKFWTFLIICQRIFAGLANKSSFEDWLTVWPQISWLSEQTQKVTNSRISIIIWQSQ